MSRKIVVIGGGSVLWMPTLGCDLLLEKSLDGSELVLVDIDSKAVELCRDYLEECVRRLNVNWRITIANEDDAMKGADVVVVSISTGGFDAMDCDYSIPEKYGVLHSVSDTTGPGGIFRTLRNAPVFLALAEKMHRLCPDAWMVHVTNPLSQITRLVNSTGLVRCCGLCHEVSIAMGVLRNFFDVKQAGDLDCNFVGVNHFTFITDLFVKGIQNPMARLTLQNYLEYCVSSAKAKGISGTVDDLVVKGTVSNCPHYFNFYLAELLGAYPAAGCAHIAENFPRFLNDEAVLKQFKLWRKGVLPERPENKAKITKMMQDILDEKKEPPEIASRSREMLADALVGLFTGEPRRIVATLPNEGQIENLPRGASVETWAVASAGGIRPVMSGKVPMSCLGFVSSVLAEQELTCEAALKKDRKLVRQALFASPLLHQKEHVDELMNDLFEAEKQWFTF